MPSESDDAVRKQPVGIVEIIQGNRETPIRTYLYSTPNVPFSFATRNSIDNSRNDFINVFLQGESFNLFENLVMVFNSQGLAYPFNQSSMAFQRRVEFGRLCPWISDPACEQSQCTPSSIWLRLDCLSFVRLTRRALSSSSLAKDCVEFNPGSTAAMIVQLRTQCLL